MSPRRLAWCLLGLLVALSPLAARAQAYGEHPLHDRWDPPPAPLPETRPPPPEPESAPFGSRGQWVITGASSVVLSQTSYNGSGATYSSVTFAPGLDTFVLRNFSVGLTLSLGFSDSKGYTADGTFEEDRLTTYAGGLRAGLVVPLSRRVSLYPRLAAGYESIRGRPQTRRCSSRRRRTSSSPSYPA